MDRYCIATSPSAKGDQIRIMVIAMEYLRTRLDEGRAKPATTISRRPATSDLDRPRWGTEEAPYLATDFAPYVSLMQASLSSGSTRGATSPTVLG
jgi:hypothetical protein